MKLKLRKIGNSLGVLLPSNVITSYKAGDYIVITLGDDVITFKPKSSTNVITPAKKENNVITPKKPEPFVSYLKKRK